MDWNVIITALIGVVATIISGWTSWYFTKEKYHTEVDRNLIDNMEQSLEFYKKLSDDNRARLEEMVKRNEALEREVNNLKTQILTLSMNICMDLVCANRVRAQQVETITTKKEDK